TGTPNSIQRVEYATADGTALEGDDYEPVSGTLVFLPGELEKSFEIPIVDNPWVEEQETVLLNLSNVTGGWPVSGQSTATLRIRDDDSAFEFAAPEFAVTENGQVAMVQVSRIGALDYPGAVFIGTADRGVHDPEMDAKVLAKLPEIVKGMFPEDVREWEMVSTTHHGEYTRATIASKPVDENSALMRFILFNGPRGEEEDGDGEDGGGEGEDGEDGGGEGEDGEDGGDEPEEPTEEPYTPTVVAVYNWVDENWELIHVNEQLPNDWVALYDTTPVEGEAGPNVDHLSYGLRIEFPIDASLATVLIPIIDDIETEPTETFGLLLSSPESGYIADQATATVGIIDDECSFDLTIASVEATENGGPLSIEIRRSGGFVNPVTIVYDVLDVTAENTVDYLKGAGRINFEAGQEIAYIVVPIINDIEMEGLETFELMLVNALVDPEIALEGSATLGEMTEIQVTVIDDEMPGGVDRGFKLVGGANGPVHSIIVDQDERILLGGDFTRVGGVLYGHVSRLHPDGYVDSSFNLGTGLDDIVWALGVQGDRKPVPGGRYTVIDGNDIEAFGRLNADGVFDDTFGIDVGVDGEVFAVAVQTDGAILIGGEFTKVAGETLRNIARLNADGTLDPTFVVEGGADRAVRDLAIQPDGKIVVVGEFGTLGGSVFSRVGRLNADGTADATFVPG
ncbi:MAG: hypothetical protein CBC62_08425, partial [Opitutia bacterium TMED102]